MTTPDGDDDVRREPGESPRSRPRSSPASKLRNYFLAGVIVVAPLGITLILVWQVVQFFDNSIRQVLPVAYNPESYLPFSIPGLGLLLVIGLITLIGMLTAGLLGRTVMGLSENLLNRMPVIRTIYGTLKQIFETVLSQSSQSFREVVLIEYPRRGLWAIGFVTGTTRGEIQRRVEPKLINVFLPTTPNPTSGFLLFVPAEEVVHLNMSVEEGIKMVISSGIVFPPTDTPTPANPEPTAPGTAQPAAKPVRVG